VRRQLGGHGWPPRAHTTCGVAPGGGCWCAAGAWLQILADRPLLACHAHAHSQPGPGQGAAVPLAVAGAPRLSFCCAVVGLLFLLASSRHYWSRSTINPCICFPLLLLASSAYTQPQACPFPFPTHLAHTMRCSRPQRPLPSHSPRSPPLLTGIPSPGPLLFLSVF